MEDLKLIGSLLPRDYMVCFATQCPQNHDCMRYLAAQFIPADVEKGVCVYPTACRNGHRRYYSQIRRVRAAKGFGDIFANVKRLNCSIVNNFFANVKRKDYMPMMAEFKRHIGSGGTYYRYKNGQLLLMPEQQEWIRQLFKRYGYSEDVKFGCYVETYDFR